MVWSDKKENWLGDLGNYCRKVQYGNLLTLGNGIPGSCFACVYVAALLDPTAFQQQEGLGRNVGEEIPEPSCGSF